MEQPVQRPRLDVGIIGCGRVGSVLGAAMRQAGHRIVATTAISEVSRERAARMLPRVPVLPADEVVSAAPVVFLCVPDDVLPDLVAGLAARGAWAPGRLAVHTSGFHGIGTLDPVARAGGNAVAMHPAMTFTGSHKDLSRLPGTPFALTASAGAELIGEALVVDLGGDPFILPEEHRPTYHLALAHSANHLVTLVAQSQQILRDIGVDDPSRLLRPLLEAALDNALEHGDKALTGPVARGDLGTVAAHLEAAGDQGIDVAMAYRALAAATARRAIARRRLPQEAGGPMRRLLEGDDSTPA